VYNLNAIETAAGLLSQQYISAVKLLREEARIVATDPAASRRQLSNAHKLVKSQSDTRRKELIAETLWAVKSSQMMPPDRKCLANTQEALVNQVRSQFLLETVAVDNQLSVMQTARRMGSLQSVSATLNQMKMPITSISRDGKKILAERYVYLVARGAFIALHNDSRVIDAEGADNELHLEVINTDKGHRHHGARLTVEEYWQVRDTWFHPNTQSLLHIKGDD